MSYAGQSKTKELKDWYEQRNWPFLGGPMSRGEYIEEMAKSKLGLVYDNEIIFKEQEK